MTRNIHDTFAKELMEEMLPTFGTIDIEQQVSSEVRTIDIVFFPNPQTQQTLGDLGLLGQILMKPAAIEAFRNAVPDWEIHNCRTKRFALHNALNRLALKENQPTVKQQHPTLWILTPTFSHNLQREHNVRTKPEWGEGIYFFSNSDRMAIIAIHQLPKTPETRFVRIFGKGSVQAEAIAEVSRLPEDYPHLRTILQNIARLRINLEIRDNKTKQIKEVIMNLSPAYDRWFEKVSALAETGAYTSSEALEEVRREARIEAKGRKKERLSIARNMLQEGVDVAAIIKLTGLSAGQIAKLR
jgi:hypothetical protein